MSHVVLGSIVTHALHPAHVKASISKQIAAFRHVIPTLICWMFLFLKIKGCGLKIMSRQMLKFKRYVLMLFIGEEMLHV